MHEPELKVSLVITDFACDPGEITRALGVAPTKSWKKGERIDPSVRRYATNGWKLESPLSAGAGLEANVKWLTERVPELSRLTAVTPQWTVEVACVGYFADRVPEMHLEPETIEHLARLRAHLDFDLYVVPATEPSGQG